MNFKICKMKSRGFGLVELMIVIVIMGILAGMTMLAIGRSTVNAEATAILADLESAKNAMLAYSMEHRTRNTDPLRGFAGAASNIINASLDKYLDSGFQSGGNAAFKYFNTLEVGNNNGFLEVGFVSDGSRITTGLRSALDRRITASGGAFRGGSSGASYSIWLRVR